jgi:hypothetical protein
MSMAPPTRTIIFEYCCKSLPKKVAVEPSSTKTIVNPRTKNRLLEKRNSLSDSFIFSFWPKATFADIKLIYTGTSGKIHGEIKDKKPAANAEKMLISNI